MADTDDTAPDLPADGGRDGNLSVSQLLPLGRLVTRLMPAREGEPATVDPDSLDDVPADVWVRAVTLWAAVLSAAIAAHFLLGRPGQMSAVGLAAAVAGRWLPYGPTYGVLFACGLLYFLSGVLNLRLDLRLRKPPVEDAVDDRGPARWWEVLASVLLFPILAVAVPVLLVLLLLCYPRTVAEQVRGAWQEAWRAFNPRHLPANARLRRYALIEERLFREGAESWGWPNRVRACLVFAGIHFVNLIYPLSTLVALTAAAAVFTAVYRRQCRAAGRRQALAEAARLHYAYNRVALLPLLLLARAALLILPAALAVAAGAALMAAVAAAGGGWSGVGVVTVPVAVTAVMIGVRYRSALPVAD